MSNRMSSHFMLSLKNRARWQRSEEKGCIIWISLSLSLSLSCAFRLTHLLFHFSSARSFHSLLICWHMIYTQGNIFRVSSNYYRQLDVSFYFLHRGINLAIIIIILEKRVGAVGNRSNNRDYSDNNSVEIVQNTEDLKDLLSLSLYWKHTNLRGCENLAGSNNDNNTQFQPEYHNKQKGYDK